MAFKASNWWGNTSRCWARETCCFIVVRTRKNWRTSAKARQKREASATVLAPLRTTLLAPDPEDPTSTTLELDELWSFVLKKANDSWMWIALCRKTRQVVGYAIGDRSKRMCQRLWESIPDLYRQGHCFTDF